MASSLLLPMEGVNEVRDVMWDNPQAKPLEVRYQTNKLYFFMA